MTTFEAGRALTRAPREPRHYVAGYVVVTLFTHVLCTNTPIQSVGLCASTDFIKGKKN